MYAIVLRTGDRDPWLDGCLTVTLRMRLSFHQRYIILRVTPVILRVILPILRVIDIILRVIPPILRAIDISLLFIFAILRVIPSILRVIPPNGILRVVEI